MVEAFLFPADDMRFVLQLLNRVDGVKVCVLASCAIGCSFKTGSGQTKDYIIGICYFSSKDA